MSRLSRHPPSRRTDATKNAPSPTDEPALEHLSFALSRAFYTYLGMVQRVIADVGLDPPLSPGTGPVLFALFEEDDRVIKDIVERVQLSYSTVSGMISRMKREGVVECRRDTEDGRSIRVRLTPLGKKLEARCRVALETVDRVMHSEISSADARSLKQTLNSMADAMRRYAAGAASRKTRRRAMGSK
jgi:DNA-binding MarR family transcriptional regulator